MKFKLSTCSDDYTEEAANQLEKLGFMFTRYNYCFGNGDKTYYVKDGPKPTIEVDTLEELMSLLNSLTYMKDMAFEQQRLIILNGEILIYDGYIE